MFPQLNLHLHRYNKVLLLAVLGLVLYLLYFSPSKKGILIPSPESAEYKARTTALVLPHHDLLISKFSDFYKFVHSDKQVTKIILLSPNHFHEATTVPQTASNYFSLADGQKVPIMTLTEPLAKSSGLVINNAVFEGEHGVRIHLPFIKKYFPDAAVLPILLTRNIPRKNLDQLTVSLKPLIDENTLLLVSTDFSHHLSYEEAEKKDAETLSLLQEDNSEKILTLNDDYMDCPSCIYVLLKLLENNSLDKEVLFHGNSAEYIEVSDGQPTTSYFVLRWQLPLH